MANKGFIVTQWTAPRLPEGVYDEFVRAALTEWSLVWPKYQSAGAKSSRLISDMLWNTPANLTIIEFETPEQALAMVTSPEAIGFQRKLRTLGALDVRTSVYHLNEPSA